METKQFIVYWSWKLVRPLFIKDKRMKGKILRWIITLLFSISLLTGVLMQNESLLNIGVSMAWIAVLLALFCSSIVFIAWYAVSFIKILPEKNKSELSDFFFKLTNKPKNRFYWLFLVSDIVGIICLILSGWIITAIAFAFVYLLSQLIKNFSLDALDNLNKTSTNEC
ncbi:DUF2700 domain-containing protein [Proteus mirabilis]|uniref:DUF2700 domain-containing protein n=1 Tax=Proteus mirabilis TaxID=584 RepID=UPI001A2EB2ED|nr:DUF2700 domain-containing protein [Proteus mirabilis]MBI6233948.1 DUF2700 domain-containing protein [Proteus mirabilis]MDC5973558.1 DUF2700 domain-containing protein [Proteus mirabilis]HEI8686387.1 DUF2700 domain-containing protein [Proteus mirabilis]